MPYENNYRAGSSWTPKQLKEDRERLEHIELLKGRPDRQTIISKDDILDLAIALHKCESVEQFIERM